jgi:hypothetical protein
VRTVTATRYVTPLREGGSLPGLVEADDDGLYVVKFRGAGQGPRALVSEIAAGELARALGLPVPELVLVNLDPRIADAEPHQEIQDLLRASAGLNLGIDFLPGSVAHSAVDAVEPGLAAAIVWLDALVMNVDRTARNTNLLNWHGKVWMIDHGASFYRHHGADEPGWDLDAVARDPFVQVRDHVLVKQASSIADAAARLDAHVTEPVLAAISASIPPAWAAPEPYVEFLRRRMDNSTAFIEEAERARS